MSVVATPEISGAMHFAFLLTMPNNNARNGKWSGEGRCYARVKSATSRGQKEQLMKLVGNHSYNFGDGWRANVQVKIITAEEKQKLLKETLGFWGYDWMIDSLVNRGAISA